MQQTSIIQQDILPNTHAELTQRSWRWIRKGLLRCRENPEDRQRCLKWCRKFPEYTHVWIEILQGKHDNMVELALETEDYFALPPDDSAWWEKILQNHPFAAIFARERYQALLQKRKQHRNDL
jgi:hypothetical protein